MKRLAFVLMLGVFMALGTRHASATLCSVPNTFTNGTVADANQVNANFSAFQTCGNNIDHSNIGNAGIYASQLVPVTVAQAIFGGGVGYTFDPNVAGQVPLTIIGATSQSADLLDVFSVGQTTKYVWVDSSGVLHTNQSMSFGGVPTWTGACSIAMGCTNSTSFTNPSCIRYNGTALVSSTTDCVQPQRGSGTVQTLGGSCANNTLCASISGPAISFSPSLPTNPVCVFSWAPGLSYNVLVEPATMNTSGVQTGSTPNFFNVSGGTIPASTTIGTLQWACF